MQNNADDEHIKKMAKLLREGATMLDLTCPKCENLLFRMKTGKIVCPTCNREVIIKGENNEKGAAKPPKAKNPPKFDTQQNHNLEKILNSKLEEYMTLLQDSSQHDEVKKILEIINLIIELKRSVD